MELTAQQHNISMETNTFTCKGCGHEFLSSFIVKTTGYCYMCDPEVTVDELLAEFDNKYSGNKLKNTITL